MSSLATALVTFNEFLKLPDPDDAKRYELHDGEIVKVPPARPSHVAMQTRLVRLLRLVEEFGFVVDKEYPYRAATNYQFWYADVAVLPLAIHEEMSGWQEYKTYSPPLIIEVLSPSNTNAKIAKQRITAMSQGTREFWVVDIEQRTVHVTDDIGKVRLYRAGDTLNVLGLLDIDVSSVFPPR